MNRESFKGWGNISSQVMTVSVQTVDTDLILPKANIPWSGNIILSAKTSSTAVTLAVTARYKIGDDVGYTQWYTLYDESSVRVNTFTSADNFTAVLYNQTWYNTANAGLQIRFTRSSGSGITTITCEGFFI